MVTFHLLLTHGSKHGFPDCRFFVHRRWTNLDYCIFSKNCGFKNMLSLGSHGLAGLVDRRTCFSLNKIQECMLGGHHVIIALYVTWHLACAQLRKHSHMTTTNLGVRSLECEQTQACVCSVCVKHVVYIPLFFFCVFLLAFENGRWPPQVPLVDSSEECK